MERPKIEINGKTYEMRKPKAKVWSSFAKFDTDKHNIPIENYIDKICEFLAEQFDGLTVDDLRDNLYIEEVQTKYIECARYFWNSLTGKFEELEKNSANTAATTESN